METEYTTGNADHENYWLDHIRRCGERQQPLSEYAKSNNLNITKLYCCKRSVDGVFGRDKRL